MEEIAEEVEVQEELTEEPVVDKPKKRRGRPPKKQVEEQPEVVKTVEDATAEAPAEITYTEDVILPESSETVVAVNDTVETTEEQEVEVKPEVEVEAESDVSPEVEPEEESEEQKMEYKNGMYIDGTFHVYRGPSVNIPYRIFVGRVMVLDVLGPWVKVRYSKGGKGSLIGYIPNV